MKKNDIRKQVEAHLLSVGFSAEAWAWNRSELLVAAGNVIRRINLKAGISRRSLAYELGRIAGMAEALGLAVAAYTGPQLVAEAA